jgi:hypothetical protein
MQVYPPSGDGPDASLNMDGGFVDCKYGSRRWAHTAHHRMIALGVTIQRHICKFEPNGGSGTNTSSPFWNCRTG